MPNIPDTMSQYVVGQKQSVVDELLLLTPYQIPMINLLGFSDAVTNTKHEWFEDSMFPYTGKITTAALDTDTVIIVADLDPFRINHVVKVGEEMMLITAINSGTNTLTVTRGFAGTTPVAITANASIEVLFVEGVEGNLARDARYKSRVPNENYTQIFDDSIKISGTAEAVAQYGVVDEYEKEKQKKLQELALQLEKAIINGVGYTNGDIRLMKGIRSYIQSNVIDAGGTDLSMTMINDAAQSIYEAGGFKNGGNFKIVVPAKQKRALSNLDTEKVLLQRADPVRGSVTRSVVTDFGDFDIVLNGNLQSDELLILDANRIRIKPLQGRDFNHSYLGRLGDFTNGMIVGEYTLEFKQEPAHARIKGLK